MGIFEQNPELFYIMVGLGALGLISVISENIVKRKKRSEPEILGFEAMRRGVSEYDLFIEAATHWKITGEQVEKDFKEYLIKGTPPF
jgi:hypothetical protein